MIINLEGGELKITSCTKMYQCTKMYNAEADTTMDNISQRQEKKTIHSFFYQIWLPPKKEKMDRLVQWRGGVGMGGKALSGKGRGSSRIQDGWSGGVDQVLPDQTNPMIVKAEKSNWKRFDGILPPPPTKHT